MMIATTRAIDRSAATKRFLGSSGSLLFCRRKPVHRQDCRRQAAVQARSRRCGPPQVDPAPAFPYYLSSWPSPLSFRWTVIALHRLSVSGG